jgi:hypothetical protein
MISKIRLVGSMHSDELERLPELGHTPVFLMPVEVQNEDGTCIGYVSVWPLHEVDDVFEAIVVAEKLAEVDQYTESVLAYWIMLIEWKGEVAERIGLGLITMKGWHETEPEWKDVKLG